ncbi:hypothetical protein FQN53_000564 [Emmonsiellopsis sp. PD_33]|nr:hypothetical protein FQN53_000564 [Emmonsiellopsis sp. PD_33]
MYAKLYLVRTFQAQDVLVMLGYLVFIPQMYFCYALVNEPGYFVHQYDLKMRSMIQPTFYILLIGSLYQAVLPLVKTAILVEWCRILKPPGNRWRSPFFVGCVAIIVLQITFGIACVVLLNVQCTPHESIWKAWMPERKCWNLIDLQLASGSIQLFSDVAMFLLPQKTIWNLQLSWKKKLGVSIVFGLGIFACVSAAVRLSVTVNFGYDPDQMYALGPLVFWVDAESTCAFFIVCIPCLPKIFKDKGVIRRVKQAFGMKVSQPGNYGSSGKPSKYGYGSKHSVGDSYRQLYDEHGVPLEDMHSSASTEQLRHPANGKIMRTRQVTVQVSSDSDVRPAHSNYR